jgi:hypothetical protein
MNRLGKLSASVIIFTVVAVATGITVGWLLTKDDTATDLSNPKISAKDYQLEQNINFFMESQAEDSVLGRDNYYCANILYASDETYAYAWIYCSGFEANADGSLRQDMAFSSPIRLVYNQIDLQILDFQKPGDGENYDSSLKALFPSEIYALTPPTNEAIAALDIQIRGKAVAVSLIKAQYPQLADYPSDNLPPRSILVEYDGQYYVAFIQNGSGVPIISARCFAIGANEIISEIGSFEPLTGQSPALNISAKTCQPVS